MTAKAIFVTGLPGSGKSCLIGSLANDVVVFDDYKANAIDDNSSFDHGRRLPELIAALREGGTCVISDIDFCRPSSQAEAETHLRSVYADVDIEWWCFENDPRQCARNVKQRARSARRDLNADLAKLREYSPIYVIPARANILPVWRPPQE